MYYNECPVCGAALDPGEPCEDCMERTKKLKETEQEMSRVIGEDCSGQLELLFDKMKGREI